MDLALNNLQRLICHKIQPTNQPTKTRFSCIGREDAWKRTENKEVLVDRELIVTQFSMKIQNKVGIVHWMYTVGPLKNQNLYKSPAICGYNDS